MSLREHFKEHFWSYTALGGLLGWAALKGEPTKEENYNVEAYDMNLHVWLCGQCHDVFDEKEEADNCCLEVTEVTEDSLESEMFKAEMFIESDGLTVQLMGFDGSFLTDGEIKMGYTTASELGYEPKQLKPVMWVWDAQEDYGAYMATDQITFLTESFGSEDFASAIIAPEKVTGPMQQALMTNYLLRKSMLDDEMRYLKQEVRSGRMSKTREQVASRRRP